MRDAVNRFPPGWHEARVRDSIEHYESQTEDEAVAEDEAAFKEKARGTTRPAIWPTIEP